MGKVNFSGKMVGYMTGSGRMESSMGKENLLIRIKWRRWENGKKAGKSDGSLDLIYNYIYL